MYCFTVKVADLVIKIETKYGYTEKLFADYICDSVSEDIYVPFSEEGLALECKNDLNAPEWYHESLYVYRVICEKILDYNAMLLHSSAVCLDGEAYLFTAPSGTGKSTHTRLWREFFGDRVFMINDDKPIIRYRNGRFYAYGTPYDGQHHISRNTHAPIKGICIIARGEKNNIKRVSADESVAMLMNQTLLPRDPEKMDTLLNLLDTLLSSVPIYRLECNISEEAVTVAYENMKN